MDIKALEKTAAEVRVGVVKAIHNAGSGHPGGSLSAADIVTALYFSEMNVDPKNPKMEGRDKFILSKGHAGPVQYSEGIFSCGRFHDTEKAWFEIPGTS